MRREDATLNLSLLSTIIPTAVSDAIKKPLPTPKTIVAPRNYTQETPVAIIGILRAVPIVETPKSIYRMRRAFPSSIQRPATGIVTMNVIGVSARATLVQSAVCLIADRMWLDARNVEASIPRAVRRPNKAVTRNRGFSRGNRRRTACTGST